MKVNKFKFLRGLIKRDMDLCLRELREEINSMDIGRVEIIDALMENNRVIRIDVRISGTNIRIF